MNPANPAITPITPHEISPLDNPAPDGLPVELGVELAPPPYPPEPLVGLGGEVVVPFVPTLSGATAPPWTLGGAVVVLSFAAATYAFRPFDVSDLEISLVCGWIKKRKYALTEG